MNNKSPFSWQHRLPAIAFALLCLAFSPSVLAMSGELDLTGSAVGMLTVAIFVLAYVLVMLEEKLHMRKSKPVLVAAGIIW